MALYVSTELLAVKHYPFANNSLTNSKSKFFCLSCIVSDLIFYVGPTVKAVVDGGFCSIIFSVRILVYLCAVCSHLTSYCLP